MRLLLTAVFCCCCAALSGAESVSFVRPVRPGDLFECSIHLRRSARYSFTLPGRTEPVVKLDTAEADFHGYILIREVNAAGNPLRLTIRRCRLSGALHGRAVEGVSPDPSAEIEADLSGKTPLFSCAGKMLAPGQVTLLQHLFPPASAVTLADLTGRSRVLPEPGEGWKADLKPFLAQLKLRRVDLPPSAFSGAVTYQGKEKIGKLDCRKFSMRIETTGLGDFDCRCRFSFSLAPSGPPVRLVRDAVEVIRQVLRTGEPLAAGTKLELIREDHTEQQLVSVPQLPPMKSGTKKNSGWDFLLR